MKKKGKPYEKSDMAEDWAEWNKEFREERIAKQEWSKELIQQFCLDNNITFTEIQLWHFRLNKDKIKMDIYPQRQRWHDVTNNERGRINEMDIFLKEVFIDVDKE
jgi:poly(3-hydroxyalkanoate) synthetase